ncbi:MAG: hypothetical protein KKC46_07015 [Proteobacteria bacterium]|nr:hypothetical protein [Pseudomonadota bacterium]
MKTKTRRFSIILVLLIPCFLFQYGRPAHGRETDLSAEQIIDKHIEATGGKKALEKINNSITEMKITLLQDKIEGKITFYKQRPNRFYSFTELDFSGVPIVEEMGTDGNIVWKIEPRTSGRIVAGEERANILINHAFDALVSWQTYFKNIQYAGMEDINGKNCYKVVMTPFQGGQRTYFFEKDTYLLIKIIVPAQIAGNRNKLESYLSDYRKINGLWIPYNLLQVIGGKEMFKLVIEDIKTNVAMPKDRFALPDKIKILNK